MADKRIDYEKMIELPSFAFANSSMEGERTALEQFIVDNEPVGIGDEYVFRQGLARVLLEQRAAAAEAQREACEKNIGKAVYATVPSVMWHAKRACAEAVRATPLITESESPDAK